MDADPQDEPIKPDDDSGEQPEGAKGGEHRRRRHRKRIKIRKRVRIKRKTSPKKKAKKLLETIAWVLVVAAFLVTLVILILQIDFSSKHRQRKRTAVRIENQQIVNLEINHAPVLCNLGSCKRVQ